MNPEILIKTNGRFRELTASAHPTLQRGLLWRLPETTGEGSFATELLGSGLSVTVSRCRMASGLHARLTDDGDGFTLVFALRGRSRNINSYFRKGFEITAGHHYLYTFPDPVLVRKAEQGEMLEAVVINISQERMRSFDEGGESTDPELTSAPDEGTYYFSRQVSSPGMNLALSQVINCPFRGRTRKMFIEGKTLELIALSVAALSDPVDRTPAVSDREHQSILRARDLLLRNIQNPPSIHDLAAAAGMSHPRMSKCFRRIFGCSAFEYLRKKRLDMSRELVAGNDMSMTEIAHAMGYANSSHFARSFFSHYGIQPSLYRKKMSRNPFYTIPRGR